MAEKLTIRLIRVLEESENVGKAEQGCGEGTWSWDVSAEVVCEVRLEGIGTRQLKTESGRGLL